MTDGHRHAQITLLLAIPSALLGIALLGPIGLLAPIGALAGLALTPDLDLESPTWARLFFPRLAKRARHSGRWLLALPLYGAGALWHLFWLPYAKLIPHRSFWSHAPVVGTLGRLAYLLALPALLTRGELLAQLARYPEACGAVALGLGISDLGHWIRDLF